MQAISQPGTRRYQAGVRLLGLGLFLAVGWVLHRELGAYAWSDVVGHLRAIPTRQVVMASLLTALGYAALTGYDVLSLHFVRQPMPYWRIALVSFVGFSLSHNLGSALVSGGAVRYRMLSRWQIPPGDVARVITMNGVTFFLGFFALGTVIFLWMPIDLPPARQGLVATTWPLGVLFAVVLATYLAMSLWARGPLRVRNFEMPVPGVRTTAIQIALSAVDWILAAAVPWMLLPADAPSFIVVLGIFLLAQVAALLSTVPAGLGVFETIVVLLLEPSLAPDVVLGSLIAYRFIYYVVPLALALPLLVGFELGGTDSAQPASPPRP
jgi:uncharacterized membrane protein YbhN (UPF0104 family)